MRVKTAALLITLAGIMVSILIAPASTHASHEDGNVNHPDSYYASTYDERGVGVDTYISIIDIALFARAYATSSHETWGIDWDFYNVDADIDDNGIVDATDLSIASWNFGLNYYYTEISPTGGPAMVIVDPPKKVIEGQEFDVTIEIKQVNGLSIYEFILSWEPELVAPTNVVSGNIFEKSYIDYIFTSLADENYIYVCGCVVTPHGATASGDGTLATITFECLDTGRTVLDLSSNLFGDRLSPISRVDINSRIIQRGG